MTLQLLISTIDQGIYKVPAMLLEPREGIGYLVSWQHTGNDETALPEDLKRPDVEVVNLEGGGLSRNRNSCIEHATADVCLIADDDCRYTHDQLNVVALTFVTHRKLDLAAFKTIGLNTAYPDKSFDLSEKRPGYHVSSTEIAFRRTSVQKRLQFNELFGLGAPVLHCGEEELFVHDAVSMGLNCVYYPAYVAEHLGDTTSTTRAASPGTLKARGAYLYIAYRSTMLPRVAIISYRLHRDHGVPFFHAVRNMLAGISYIKKHMQ